MHKITLIVIIANKNHNKHDGKVNKFLVIIWFYHNIMVFSVIFIHSWLWRSWKCSLYLMFFIFWIVTMKTLIIILVCMIFIIFWSLYFLWFYFLFSWILLILVKYLQHYWFVFFHFSNIIKCSYLEENVTNSPKVSGLKLTHQQHDELHKHSRQLSKKENNCSKITAKENYLEKAREPQEHHIFHHSCSTTQYNVLRRFSISIKTKNKITRNTT